MPYVPSSDRIRLENHQPSAPNQSGELSYKLCHVINEFLATTPNGGWEGAIAKVYSALAGAELAFNIEIGIPYESYKREKNGAVFTNARFMQQVRAGL
jgi:hypothetical protein